MLVAFREGFSSFIPPRHRCSNRVLCAWNEFLLKRQGVLYPPKAWVGSRGLRLLTALSPSYSKDSKGSTGAPQGPGQLFLLGNCSLTV